MPSAPEPLSDSGIATMFRTVVDSSVGSVTDRVDADRAWAVGVRTKPRSGPASWTWSRRRGWLPAVGVAATVALVVGVVLVVRPGGGNTAPPATRPSATATPAQDSSAELGALLKPLVDDVLKPYHLGAAKMTIGSGGLGTPATVPLVGIVAGTVGTPSGSAQLSGVPAWHLIAQQFTSQRDPVAELGVDNGTPVAAYHGTLPGGITWASSSGGEYVEITRPDGLDLNVSAAPIITNGSGAAGRDRVNGQDLEIAEFIATHLRTLPPPPRPRPLPTQRTSGTAALDALVTASRSTDDPAASGGVLYIDSSSTATNPPPTTTHLETWLQLDSTEEFTYASITLKGKVTTGGSYGHAIIGALGLTTWQQVRALPTDPDALQARVNAYYDERQHDPQTIFTDLTQLITNSAASPRLQAAVAVVLAHLPSATVTTGATTQTNRRGTAITVGTQRAVFDPATGELAETDMYNRSGGTTNTNTILSAAHVEALARRPDGTVAPKS